MTQTKHTATAKIGTRSISFTAEYIESVFKALSCFQADAEADVEECSVTLHGNIASPTIQMAHLSEKFTEWGWHNNLPDDVVILDDEPRDLWDEPASDGLTKEQAQEIEAMILAERDEELDA
jgi:hypothetical protein